MTDSPSTDFYFLGKGIVSFTPAGGVKRDLGNCPDLEVTPASTKLDHFSSRSGIKTKDKSVVTEFSMTVKVVLEEITAENLALLLLGSVDDTTDGVKTLEMGSVSDITGALDLAGTNDVGAHVDIHIPSVTFSPSGSFSAIGDNWGSLEITGDINVQVASDGSRSFGTMTITENPTS